jgi:CrcB protein
MAMMMLLWVMLAGGLGSGARYLVGAALVGTTFPYATVIVNLTGCFLIGVLAQLALTGTVSLETRTVLAAGFLGGFTTYSSFNHETLMLFAAGSTGSAIVNVAVTLVGGLAAGSLGMMTGRLIAPVP